ncbi:MAG: hypothetical protein A2312_00305 [Candidatus Staskawiczbacteria bacterium RIFOXYB2_FULL_32_9]|uniref:Thioredoxin-like fold domain-containing protein n=1 Tax=Candidatus Staskawiczbacteria bacterium RIFOXYD1_FULL_32_13 TaxID=1802234 RepID=A0A1G2JJV3_9BACT|nr:MAG: Protein-disulfide isomerase-like protein [Parcubacteria group bacterium GW2011_GWC2_32_10]OGZ77683.1 MAG: hypothetical protein A2256_04370 [Candidatus Staskawiczbacteria bacterium RIFOXYA2_FULL_32_7]OGZ79496.1 MAG: hypothetical protein A2360_02215 [Candidatus Staskawiczbacteria bacterium RIFOXYB1_FULL_32_11]OGZ84864.1 MAG: hypothetical protein A2312_00305 [Candidatus Staskawiczbacteria bacterium RIFOXYB2_FULL_32_9]OGZ87409.1 MAG: hypothetical protein A2561_05000 [Candidatus Staskawiczba
MICIIALVVFSIMGIFSLTYRNLAKEAFDCVFRRITFRPCNTGFNEKIKSQLVAKLLNKSVFAARIFNKYFEVFSWAFLILMVWSTFYTVRGGYNYYLYGSCNGLNQVGFCALDPGGNNNKVTEISNGQCGLVEKKEENVTLDNVDLSSFPTKNVNSKDTIVLIGCYECDYTRKAYLDIQKLVKEKKTNYIFAHYPAKEDTNYLSEVGYCVYKEYGERFWEFNDYLFTVDKTEIYQSSYVNTILNKYNFDVEKINNCINNPLTKEAVNNQLNQLIKTHLYGTPTVFINGKAFVGPKPYRVYKSILNKFIIF